MKNLLLAVAAAAGLTCVAQAADVVISQVYGGGSNTGAPYNQDFVELHNITAAAVTVPAGGWSLQYGSAAGNFASNAATKIDIPGGTVIPAGGFFLIGGATGATGGPLPVTPDINPPVAGNFNMSGTAGKVALVNGTVALNANNCADPLILDMIAYGNPASVPNCTQNSSYALLPAGTGSTNSLVRNGNRCQDSDTNGSDFTASAVSGNTINNSASAPSFCNPCTDCNGNVTCDSDEINAAGGSGGVGGPLDCNTNGLLDSCEIAGNPSSDCNNNSTLDSCEIAGNPSLDCNGNLTLDSCEIAANPAVDSCNSNGIIDSCETPGPGQDCNGNNLLDCIDLKTGLLTDADGNGTPDSCEGAAVTECDINATVQPAGIRPTPNGAAFFNVEGDAYGAFASYGALRWDVSTAIARFNTDFGAGQWQITRAYLYFQQGNAAFTVDSLPDGIQLYYSNLDALDISVQATVNPARMYPNFATDWTDADLIRNYTFTRGPGGSGGSAGSGTVEAYSLYSLAGPNNSAMTSVGADLNAASGALTLLVNTNDSFATATYAGNTNTSWRGPSLVLFAESTGGNPCDFADANCDGALNGFDVEAMEQAVNGDFSNYCLPTDDPNQDGASNGFDIEYIEGLINIC